MAAFAAIQYGVSILRANGKGITALIDPNGEVLQQFNTFLSDSDIFYAEVPLNSATTVYSVTGDLFVFILMVILAVVIGIRIIKKGSQKANQ
jgi:apolipoprotein N-acyltransferase